MECKFRNEQGRCTIGCKSVDVKQGETCPLPFLNPPIPFKLCPCHPEGLTFILSNRVKKLLSEEIESAELIDDKREIDRLVKAGHTYNCACRIVWGDGECECHQVDIIKG